MDYEDSGRRRLIGDYILGPKIGSGSFAVVWLATHRQSGIQVAVKEIDKKQLSPIVGDNLFKEISILNTIRHPNIIRLFEAIQTAEKIYLVLEYCDGGDLGGYIHRHGKVSEAVARHLMKQLAAGLKVLNEKHLIHRDLKPQNLLLSTNETSPLLKIGDFGFARYLRPQGLADTLCGSPLYMAPEIIQNLKYDAKADLWSVGAILFQLVIGKPPFEGNSQLQLFQNVLTSSELRFPKGALEVLHPDFVDLCRSLLRRNPVERLSFMEFFNHNFLAEPKLPVDVHQSSLVLQIKSLAELTGCLRDQSLPFAFNKRPHLLSEDPLISSESNPKLTSPSLHDDSKIISRHKDHRSTSTNRSMSSNGSTSSNRSFHGIMPNAACDELRKYDGGDLNSSDQLRVSDSMESIERGYVLVNPHFASMGTFSSSVETSLLENSTTRVSIYPPRTTDQAIAVALQTKELIPASLGGAGSLGEQSSNPSKGGESTILKEVQGPSILHPSTRLQLLHQYATTLSTLVQEKFNAGLFVESFSVELVVLALWKETLRVCSSWVSSTAENDVPGSCPPNKSTNPQEKAGSSSKLEENVDFDSPSSVFMWAEQGFISAFDRAEKLSGHLRKLDGNAEMPDAMEIIYQTGLAVGKSGAVDEYFENKPSAAAAYAKAKLLLSFILGEATSLPLNPPFSLTPPVKKQIQKYITKLEIHLTHSQMP